MSILTGCKQQGFTLIELVVVIILLGVTSVGVARILGLATQNYVNSAERDELSNSARFVLERLNKELPHALPNSVREFSVTNNGNTIECLEFVPIIASSTSLDLTHITTNQFNVIEFNQEDGSSGTCSSTCGNVAIYTLSANDVYVNPSQTSGQLFSVSSIVTTAEDNVWQVTLNNAINVEALSPSEQVYFVDEPVRYCLNNDQLLRATNYTISDNLTSSAFPVNASRTLMAENISTINFTIQNASLTRNAVVLIDITFQSTLDNTEVVPFSHEIAIFNTP